jgi:hypothetical protein
MAFFSAAVSPPEKAWDDLKGKKLQDQSETGFGAHEAIR